jgi:hypothetical protein
VLRGEANASNSRLAGAGSIDLGAGMGITNPAKQRGQPENSWRQSPERPFTAIGAPHLDLLACGPSAKFVGPIPKESTLLPPLGNEDALPISRTQPNDKLSTACGKVAPGNAPAVTLNNALRNWKSQTRAAPFS